VAFQPGLSRAVSAVCQKQNPGRNQGFAFRYDQFRLFLSALLWLVLPALLVVLAGLLVLLTALATLTALLTAALILLATLVLVILSHYRSPC
jgi:hypothetical protein